MVRQGCSAATFTLAEVLVLAAVLAILAAVIVPGWCEAGPDGRFRRSAGSPSGTNYEDRFRSETHRVGGRLFVTEFSENIDTVGFRPLLQRITGRDPLAVARMASHLTRLRAVMTPQAMDRDVPIQPTPGAERVWHHHDIAAAADVGRQGSTAPLAVMCAAVCVLVLGLRLLNRSPWGRAVGGLCVFVGCVVLTMV